jgi:adenylate cyclase
VPKDDHRDHPGPDHESVNLDALLEQRERIESLLKERFTRTITIMFTDLKGSTSLTESQGDFNTRFLIKKHNDILFAAIEGHNGVLVKTMGDGSMSYFPSAPDAVRSAVQFQTGLEEFNNEQTDHAEIMVRVGLNTGTGIVEKTDIFGDVVNVAARFESIAQAGEILISESTFESLGDDRGDFQCRFLRTTSLKEKSGSFKVFKVFWRPGEYEESGGAEGAASVSGPSEPAGAVTTPSDPAAAGESYLFPQPGEVPSPEAGSPLQKAMQFEKEKEHLQLYLFCEGQGEVKECADAAERLREDSLKPGGMASRFFGEEALWFGRDHIVWGRVPNADVPLSNKAVSRVPLLLKVRDGEGYLEAQSHGKGIKGIEIRTPAEIIPLRQDMEYRLGKRGTIVFSECFPFEYAIYENRLITLKALESEECLKAKFNMTLDEVWKDHAAETRRIIVVGR